MFLLGLALMLMLSPTARAQEANPSPSPKELWEAYPLDPGEVPPTATPSAEFSAAPTATPRPASEDDGGSAGWIIAIVLAAPFVFVAGVFLGHRRDRIRAATPAAMPADGESLPVTERRFEKRDYPAPARPAPPPPPVPGRSSPTADFEAALEEERAAEGARPRQKEPH